MSKHNLPHPKPRAILMLVPCKIAGRLPALRVWLLLCLFLPIPAKGQSVYREPAFRDNFYDVALRDQSSWIVGYYGTILYSGNRGLTWTIQNGKTQQALFRVAFIDRNIGWVSGSYGTILHTRDSGTTWQKQETHTEEHLFGLHFLDARLGWAAGSGGVILRTEDGGNTWVNASVGEDIILNDVHFLNPKQGWAAGEFGRIYRTNDGGRSWIKQKSPIEVSFISGESRNLFRLLFPDARGGWAFGLDGVILKTGNGERWDVHHPHGAASESVLHHHLFSAALFNGRTWAVGERGTVLSAALGEKLWKAAPLKISPVSLNGIAFGHDGLGLIVGNRGLILRTEDGGNQWEQLRIVPESPGKGVSQIP